jgi:hypothetical protein
MNETSSRVGLAWSHGDLGKTAATVEQRLIVHRFKAAYDGS